MDIKKSSYSQLRNPWQAKKNYTYESERKTYRQGQKNHDKKKYLGCVY